MKKTGVKKKVSKTEENKENELSSDQEEEPPLEKVKEIYIKMSEKLFKPSNVLFI